jgi:hypothetical protein
MFASLSDILMNPDFVQKEATPSKRQKTEPKEKVNKDENAKKKETKRKEKPTKLQVAFERAMADHTKYQKESDNLLVSQMKDQFEKEVEIRKEELNAYTSSIALLANAIAGRQQPPPQQQPLQPPMYHYPIHADDANQQTYYKL